MRMHVTFRAFVHTVHTCRVLRMSIQKRNRRHPRAFALDLCTLTMWQHVATRCSTRCLYSSLSSRAPWFIDSSDALLTQQTSFQKETLPPLPPGIPVVLRTLHAELVQSPYLEPSKLLVRDPIPQPTGPPLPLSTPRGRRKRGGTYAGEGLLEPGNLWNWIVLAQVRS